MLGSVKRVIVIGAGTMGLEAALLAATRGHDVTVLEQGEVGDAIRRWGPTRCFSPFAMNVSARARALLAPDCGWVWASDLSMSSDASVGA